MVFSDKSSFSRNQLYDRFWTIRLINVFLKEHDSVEFSNDFGWPRYLYDKKRVFSIEGSLKFKEELSKSMKRRGLSKKSRTKG